MTMRFILAFAIYFSYNLELKAAGCTAPLDDWWVLMDSSGSMQSVTASGETREKIAIQGVSDFINTIYNSNPNVRIGFIKGNGNNVALQPGDSRGFDNNASSFDYYLRRTRSGNGGNPYSSLDLFANNVLTSGQCFRAVIVTDGTDGSHPIAAASTIASKCSCLFIVGIDFNAAEKPTLQQVALAGNGSFCNGSNSYRLTECLLQSFKPYKYDQAQHACLNSEGLQGLNGYIQSNPPSGNDYTCFDFSFKNFNSAPWNQLVSSGRDFRGSSFDGSDLSGIAFKGIILGGNNFNQARMNGTDVNSLIEHSTFHGTEFNNTILRIGNGNLFKEISKGNLSLLFPTSESADNRFVNIKDFSLMLNASHLRNANLSNFVFDNYLGSLNVQNIQLQQPAFNSVKFKTLDFKNVSLSEFKISDFEASLQQAQNINFDLGQIDGRFDLRGIVGNQIVFNKTNAQNLNLIFENISDFSITQSKIFNLKIIADLLSARIANQSIINNALVQSKSANFILQDSSCQSCNFENNIFKTLKVMNSNISESNFRNTVIKDGEIINSKGMAIDFGNSQIEQMKIENTELNNSIFFPLKGTENIMFSGVILDQCNLEQFKFIASGIQSTSLKDANLRDAKFPPNVPIENIFLDRAELAGVNLSDRIFKNASFWGTKNVSSITSPIMDLKCLKCFFRDLPNPFSIRSGIISESGFENGRIKFQEFTGIIQKTLFVNTTIESQSQIGNSIGAELQFNDFSLAKFEKPMTFENVRFIENIFRGVDLNNSRISNSSLQKDDLEDTKLEESIIFKSSFKEVNLNGTSLKESRISETDFFKLALAESYWQRANLMKITFDQIKFTVDGAQPYGFSKITGPLGKATQLLFKDSDLSNVFLPEIELSHSKFVNTSLAGSDLSSSSFEFVEFFNVDFKHANLQYSKWGSVFVNQSNFQSANFSDSSFYDSRLEHSDLRKIEGLSTAKFFSNNGMMSFKGSNLSDLNFQNHTLMRTDFSESILDYTSFTDAILYESNFNNARFDNTDFSGAKPCNATFGNANTWDTIGLNMCTL